MIIRLPAVVVSGVLYLVLGWQLAVAEPANGVDPVLFLQRVTGQVMEQLRRLPEPRKTRDTITIVNRLVLPHIDFNEMAKWIAGRTAWGRSSEETKQQFIKQFSLLVVRTYAISLNDYTDEKISFTPWDPDKAKRRRRVQISSKVLRVGKEPIRVDYRLIAHADSWQVYDIVIEGVSILKGFQAQFSDEIRQRGLQPVVDKILLHNKEQAT